MNLRTFPSTAGDAISSSSNLILPRKEPAQKTTTCRRRAVSARTLKSIEVVTLAAAVGSAAAALSLAMPESSWAARYSVPPASLDPAGAESSLHGSMG
jgi:hypothetical protein